MAHYYSDRTSFYGIAVDRFLPFNFLRDVHIQSPIVWIGLSWIGAALFLAPAIGGGRKPKGQRFLVDLLFWVTLLIVAGALVGNYLGIMGYHRPRLVLVRQSGPLLYPARPLLADRLLRRAGDVERAGVPRAVADARALWRQAAGQFWTGRIRLEHLIWASTVNIAVLYVFGMIPLTGIEKSFTHHRLLALVGGPSLGRAVVRVLRRRDERLSADGGRSGLAQARRAGGLFRDDPDLPRRRASAPAIISIGRASPGMWVPMGSMFSFIEVLPLVLLIIEAIKHYRLIKAHQEFKYRLAYTYIIGAAFWNFVGAGVFGGGTLNAPLVNYYEHGTFLTLNHAHTALFGAFGELAIGLIYFCLRYIARRCAIAFSEKLGLWAFWLYNGGLVLWIVLQLLPDRLGAARCGL